MRLLRLKKEVSILKKAILPALTNQLWVGDFDIMKIQFEGICQLPYVQFIRIHSEDTESIFSGERKTDNFLDYTFQMEHEFKKRKYNLGTFYIQFDLDAVYSKVFEELFLILRVQTIVTFLVSIFIFIIFQRLVMRHLGTIAGYSRKLNINSLTNNLELQRKSNNKNFDELQEVVNGLNEMRKSLLNETQKITRLNDALVKFVPQDFLNHLDKQSIADVRLGDSIEYSMSVLFTDIRSFTSISESMNPEDNFRFLNNYFSRMGSIIRDHKGFIDKYIGDAIMALFDKEPDDAVMAGIEMINQLHIYNKNPKFFSINMGIGIHKGKLMLGTIGEVNRMETTVISDAVNLASRLEGMTKIYGTPLIISGSIYDNLKTPENFAIRILDKVQAKGKKDPVTIYEVYNSDIPEHYDKKSAIRKNFEKAVKYYQIGEFEYAKNIFEKCQGTFKQDKVTHIYLNRCNHLISTGVDKNWNGITILDEK